MSLAKTIERIRNAGFSHVKVELEGDLGRDTDYCDECEEGIIECYDCDGEGFVDSGDRTRLSNETVMVECDSCYGEGNRDCGYCEGSGSSSSEFGSEENCEEFMRNFVPQEVNERLTYGRFYEDGSVDSEFTFTVPVEHIEDIVHWQKAFVALSEQCGRLDVDGAGLHIAVLPKESHGSYPVMRNTMPANRVRNFESEVTKLLPALYFLASSNHQSRGLNYRPPQVASDKYSAISHHDRSSFEFRVFETCYDKPEAIFDYLEVIANCLEFYANPELKVEAIGATFGFNEGNHLVSRFYSTPEQLKILNATVKHLKPKNKSLKKLKQERGMDYGINEVKRQNKEKINKLRKEYFEYKKRWLENFHKPLSESEQRDVQRIMLNENVTENIAKEYLRNSGRLTELSEFLRSNNRVGRSYQEIRV